MRIQYFSDIHLEFGDCELSLADTDILVAAGDIHTEINGLGWLAQAGCPVIYIAGNHEYYGGDLVHTLNQLESASKQYNINFLENTTFFYRDTRFIGTTLWTNFNDRNRELMEHAIYSMNDYNFICRNEQLATPVDILNIHEASYDWLENELSKPFTGKTVVITHHAPSTRSWNNAFEIDRKFTYCNEMDCFIRQYQIDLWIHGHIHFSVDYLLYNTRIVCNPRGYAGYQVIDGFSIDKVIEI